MWAEKPESKPEKPSDSSADGPIAAGEFCINSQYLSAK
jgi:hypothetical protein